MSTSDDLIGLILNADEDEEHAGEVCGWINDELKKEGSGIGKVDLISLHYCVIQNVFERINTLVDDKLPILLLCTDNLTNDYVAMSHAHSSWFQYLKNDQLKDRFIPLVKTRNDPNLPMSMCHLKGLMVQNDKQVNALINTMRHWKKVVKGEAKFQPEPGYTVVGDIQYNEEDELSKCKDKPDIRVFRGFLGKIVPFPVAVKRFPKEYSSEAKNEAKTMEILGIHSNILRFYLHHEDDDINYIVYGPWRGNLKDCMKKPKEVQFITVKAILKQIMEGLKHMHSKCIVHTCICAENIIIIPDGDQHEAAVISSFGHCKESDDEAGKREDIRRTGYLFYYMLSGGNKLDECGDELKEKLTNICGDEFSPARDLMSIMLDSEGLTAQEVIKHPYFWEDKMKADFFQRASDYMLAKDFDKSKASDAANVLRKMHYSDWTKLSPEIEKSKMPKYDSLMVFGKGSLLRCVRNMCHHIEEVSQGLKDILGTSVEQIAAKFDELFPRLLLTVYKILKEEPHRSSEPLKSFYHLG